MLTPQSMSLAVSGSRSLESGGELADLVERVAGESPAPELLMSQAATVPRIVFLDQDDKQFVGVEEGIGVGDQLYTAIEDDGAQNGAQS